MRKGIVFTVGNILPKKEFVMRNVVICVIVGFVFLGCASAPTSNEKAKLNIPAPVFDRPHSTVLDMWSYGSQKYKDYVKVFNSTLHENISFNVFGYDEKNERWVLIGAARLKQVTDRDTISSPLNGELKQFRWFTIHSLDGLDFNAQVVINSNDVLITIFEEGLNDR